MVELMYMQLLRKLLAEVRAAEWYSIIADETRDLSGAEQFAISLRWVDRHMTELQTRPDQLRALPSVSKRSNP